jgi:hypothetical protein
MTTNIQSFAGDVQIDSGNLSVKSLEVKDGVTKLGSNNTAYSNVGVMMTRKDGASNVAFLFTEDGANVVLGYTNDDALEGDRIDILTDEKANLVVYGNVYVTGSVHGDGSTLTGLVTTLQSVTEFGADTDQTILFTNEITGINVSSNVLVSGNVTANVYYGDGGLLANITQTLEGITAIGNTTPYTLEFNNTDTSFVTVSNVGIGNALPTADLCVGSNVVIDDERLNKINVVGNVACHQLNLGSVEILPAYSLENVTQISNTTTNTMSFNNSTLAFDTQKMAGIGIIPSSADVGVSGLHVDGHLRLGGEAENTDEEQMYIKAAGALGVLANESDTNNTNTELRLQSGDTNNSNITMVGKSSAQYMTFGTNAAERMRIDSSGNIGIGTTSPSVALEVFKDGGNMVKIGNSGSYLKFDNGGHHIDVYNTSDGSGRLLYLNKYSKEGVEIDDRLGVGGYPTKGGANLYVYGNTYITSNLTVGTDDLHVDTTTGNVGIGTTSPDGRLHISSGTSGDCHLILQSDTDNNNESDNPKIVFRQDGAINTAEIGLGNNMLALRGTSGIAFYDGTASATNIDNIENTSTELMRITDGGNVGIGTDTPQAKLDTRGDAVFDTGKDDTTLTGLLNYTSTQSAIDAGVAQPASTGSISASTDINPPPGVAGDVIAKYVNSHTSEIFTSSFTAPPLSITTGDVIYYGLWVYATLDVAIDIFKFGGTTQGTNFTAIGNSTWTWYEKTITSTSTTSSPEFRIDNNTPGRTYYFTGFTIRQNPSQTTGLPFTPQYSPASGRGPVLSTQTLVAREAAIKTLTGNVGVGKTNPAYPLDVEGETRATSFRLNSLANTTITDAYVGANPYTYFTNSNDNDNSYMQFLHGFTDVVQAGSGPNSEIMSLQVRGKSNGTTDADTVVYIPGYLGVGTANPEYTLHVVGTGGFSSNLTVGTANLHVDTTTGFVGVGTTNPDTSLHIKPQSVGDIIKFHGASTGDRYVTLENRHGTIFDTNPDYPNTLYNFKGNSSYIDYGFSNNNGDLVRIKYNGNVGVGTTNPQGILHVNGGTGDAKVIIEADTNNSGESDNPKIVFRQDGGYYTGEVGLANNQMVFRSKSTVNGNTGFIFYSNVGATSTTNVDDVEDTQLEVMRIQGNGYVGIGTANPTRNLHVAGDAYVSSNLTVNTDDLHVDTTTGFVGVGTANPQGILHILDQNMANATELLRLEKGGGTGDIDDTSFGHIGMYLVDANEGGGEVARISYGHNGGSGTQNEGKGQLGFWTSNTGDAEGVPEERMTIRANGNVGIGTTNPETALDVEGTITIRNGSQLNAIRTDSDGNLQFLRNASTNDSPTITINDETGNVGVGTTDPSYTLDVNGTAYVSSNLTVGTSNLFVDTTTGFVGVGTTKPTSVFNTFGGQLWDGDDHTSKVCATLRVGRGGGDGASRVDYGTGAILEFRHESDYRYVTIESVSDGGQASAQMGLLFKTTPGGGGPVERMRIKNNGNVGIGTDDPSYTLDVNGNMRCNSFTLSQKGGDQGEFIVERKDNGYTQASLPLADTTAFAWNTSIPDVDYTTVTSKRTFTIDDNNTGSRWMLKFLHTDADSSTIVRVRVNSGTLHGISYNDVPQDPRENGDLSWTTIDITDDVVYAGATNTIYWWATNTDGGNIKAVYVFPTSGPALPNEPVETDLHLYNGLYVSSNLTVNTDDLFVDTTTGFVGIGTDNPNYALHVYNSDFTQLELERSTAGGGVAMKFRNGDGDAWQVGCGGDGTFGIYNGATFGEQFFITTDGNVGIGQTTDVNQRLYIKSGHNYTSDTSSNIVANSTLRIQPGYSSTMSLYMGKSEGDAIYQQVSQYTGGAFYNLSLQPYGGHVGMGIKDGDKIGSTSFSGNYDSYASILHMQGGQVWYGDLSDNETWRTLISSNDYLWQISVNNGAFSSVARIEYNTGTYTDLITFTGQHRCAHIRDVHPSAAEDNEGLIVCANRDVYESVNGERRRGISAITVNESVPLLSLSNVAYDKTCFGVISSSEDPDERKQNFGNFVSNGYKESGDTFIFVNSVGEGGMWVVNTNGALDSGDFITTSDVAGYGQRQESEFLANYTVAKITMRCDFNPPDVPKQRIVRAMGDVQYWVNKKYFNTTEDEYSNLAPNRRTTELVTEYLSSTETLNEDAYNTLSTEEKDAYTSVYKTIYKRVEVQEESKKEKEGWDTEIRQELVNVLDEHGQLQWEDDPSGATEPAYKIRYLDASGQQTDQANAVHIAAFVGCTYHCG